MGYRGRLSITIISLMVGIPYCVYNYITLQSSTRTLIDMMVLITVTAIVYWLGMQYDRATFYHKELKLKQQQLLNSYQQLMASQQKLRELAYYDELTSLPNRVLLYNYLKKSLIDIKQNKQMLAVLFIDLDGFKEVNDRTGHNVGDMLLKEIGKRIQSCVRNVDLVSRLGGDEFIVVLSNCDREAASDVANRIIREVSYPYHFNHVNFQITASIGASIAPDDGDNEEDLIQNADKAMYFAKSKGKNTFAFYDKKLVQ
ncbi:GGDEF domain-containing protein [Bacillus sp. DNRA2]|uniref:GGDEF domain-containing protein n=1 Tax=Bacillus sp. DNRA2 TaxID=2723053 RepID=UPI00145F4D82|nr:GGDEF domain-containing protein [Bacillus sp. DNRA2]NMD70505.1 GGDEF domain-containing protein [Bacillus sp. DNRA2]